MKIPFGWLPSSWGLCGSTREIAEAEYTLSGVALDDKLAEIKYRDDDDTLALEKAKLKNRKKHNLITNREFAVANANLTLTGVDLECELLNIAKKNGDITERAYLEGIAKVKHTGKELQCSLLYIARQYNDLTEREYRRLVAEVMIDPGIDLDLELLEIDFELNLIDKQPYEKQCADIRGEPYICVLNSEYNPDEKLNGLFFEFDWNDKWIEELKAAGYTGFTDDQIVQRWFTDICRGVVRETDDMMAEDLPLPFNSSRITKQVPNSDGTTGYR